MESKYRGLLEAAPDAMVVVNQRGEIVLLNVQAEKQFGYRRDELLGQKVTNIIPVGFAERLVADDLRSTEEALAQQIGTGIELIALRKDGSEFPIEIMLSPLESTDGILVTAAVRNISERKSVEEERKRLERLKDEFVATVSHELRTPLTSIAGALGLLTGSTAGQMPESATRLLTIAYTNCQRLIRLLNDILDIEKMDSGKAAFEFKRVEVRALVEQVIEANRAYAQGCDVRVRLDAASATFNVRADPDRLMQAITNLLSNAIKFSPPGEGVVVVVETRGDTVRISVRDHGLGVPEEFKPHIFEKFAQDDGTDARQKGGTGLGLSIVKQIVERLDGAVGFGDAPGGGAIFHVDLPVWARAIRLQSQVGGKSQLNVLLCEDNPEAAIVLVDRLRQEGFLADVALTANEAVACVAATSYAAILVDLQLPEGDGIGLIKQLRAQPQIYNTLLVVLSAILIRPTMRSSPQPSSIYWTGSTRRSTSPAWSACSNGRLPAMATRARVSCMSIQIANCFRSWPKRWPPRPKSCRSIRSTKRAGRSPPTVSTSPYSMSRWPRVRVLSCCTSCVTARAMQYLSSCFRRRTQIQLLPSRSGPR
jgi:PAS domain S-box-containing protein